MERVLPWYDVELERKRDERSAAIRRRAVASRIMAERIREAYIQAARRVAR